jgi:arylsulfatase
MDRWELYHVAEDFSESRDLAGTYPDKLKALQELFDVEARKNDVYPLGAVFNPGMKPSLTSAKREFIYYSGTQRIPDALLPDLAQSSYRMTADVLIPESGVEGVIASYGNRRDGFVWYIKDGYLVYENRFAGQHQILTSQMLLPRGRTSLAFAFERSVADKSKEGSKWWEGKWWEGSSGIARLYINGQMAAEAALSQFLQAQDAAMFIGRAAGPPVSTSFSQAFAFSGTLESVTVEMQ